MGGNETTVNLPKKREKTNELSYMCIFRLGAVKTRHDFLTRWFWLIVIIITLNTRSLQNGGENFSCHLGEIYM